MAKTRCVVMVTHNRRFLQSGNRIFYIDRGIMVFEGTYQSMPRHFRDAMGGGAVADEAKATESNSAPVIHRISHEPRNTTKSGSQGMIAGQ